MADLLPTDTDRLTRLEQQVAAILAMQQTQNGRLDVLEVQTGITGQAEVEQIFNAIAGAAEVAKGNLPDGLIDEAPGK
ncbi:MAG: hypothetical protein KME27_10705 [Lyngbya sp. HA4199-MV5]|jgi:hypothetical protein|nr:hypothetical protein [Lyngbya sp. HA4199-MV5]